MTGSRDRYGSRTAQRVLTYPPLGDEFSGFGEQSISNAQNNYDIWGGASATQPEPNTSGYALYVKSDNAADDGDPAGTGARTVHVHYLDTGGVPRSVTATLNGTTEVDTGVTDCMFVQQHHIVTVGSGLVAAGNVDCLAGSGGSVVSRIAASGNQSMSTMRQVPAGFQLVLTGWRGAGVAATTKIANLRIRASEHDGVTNPGVYHFIDSVRVKDNATGEIPILHVVPPLATVKVSAWTDGTIDVGASWVGYLQAV